MAPDLFEATCRGDAAATGALLDAGAELEGAREEDGRTALHCAAACGHAAVVSLLLERDADVDAEDEDGSTPLHLAAAAGHLESVRLLLEKSDVDAEDSNGNTPAWVAFAAGQGDLARFLLEEGGADLDAACEDGKTYLHQAAQRKSADDVAWLLAHKASVKAKDRFSDSPLHAAAAAGAWRIGRVLIDSGADVNARGKNACTPLHVAALNPANVGDRASFIELLLSKGADPSALNKECSRPVDLVGSTARAAADEEDDADVRHLLLEADAS